uniref:Uncharacterized protein n=1 Tax=Lepeophtheirus salmonis TaxID=72036 RepID=A0A0K2TB12_LEPSM
MLTCQRSIPIVFNLGSIKHQGFGKPLASPDATVDLGSLLSVQVCCNSVESLRAEGSQDEKTTEVDLR